MAPIIMSLRFPGSDEGNDGGEVGESEYYFWLAVVQKALHLLLMNFLKNLPNVGVIHPSCELTAVLRACVIKLSTAQLIHLRRM